MTGSDILVTVDATEFRLDPDDVFTFGRSPDCTMCLDSADTGISRLAGAITSERSSWWLENRSCVRRDTEGS